MWIHRPHWAVYLPLLGFVGGFAGMSNWIRVRPGPLSILVTAGYVALFVFVVYIVRRMQQRGHMAAATTDGLHLRLGNLTPSFTPRDEISRASHVQSTAGFATANVYFRQQKRIVTVAGIFKTPDEAMHFAEVVNAYTSEAEPTHYAEDTR